MDIYQGDLFLQAFDELGDDWFLLLVEDEDLVHRLPEGSDTLLSGVRRLSTTWRALGIRAGDTMAYAWSKPERVHLTMDITDQLPFPDYGSDRPMKHGLATLRLDYFGTSIRAAWVSSERSDEDEMPEPTQDEIVFSIEPSQLARGIDEAIGWLLTQARRPIHRLEWSQDGETVARRWLLADTGRSLAWSTRDLNWSRWNPQTATAVLQVSPNESTGL